ncbi:hypothetical protein ABT263_25180 [Kitasatospora sp. NPDC001603]|uniref:hypothetical protein n=1 Tax=Kitasatospora sp. NPDC001603 TaxID=3154388 RepID=UPI0033271B5B
MHEFARRHPGDDPETFLPTMPGAPLRHPAAVLAASYLEDSEIDPVEQCSALLILAHGALRDRAARKN